MWAEAQDCEEEETILAVAFQDVLGCETRAEWGWGGKCSQDGRWASAYFSFASLESEPYIIPPHTWQIKCQLSNQVLSTFFLLNSEAIYIFTILSCLPVLCEAVPLLHADCCACALHIFFSSSFSFTYLFFSRIVRFFFFLLSPSDSSRIPSSLREAPLLWPSHSLPFRIKFWSPLKACVLSENFPNSLKSL